MTSNRPSSHTLIDEWYHSDMIIAVIHSEISKKNCTSKTKLDRGNSVLGSVLDFLSHRVNSACRHQKARKLPRFVVLTLGVFQARLI